MTAVDVRQGDLLDQDVEVLVNAWNRNLIPWWLLLPQGVSGALKRRAGTAPFRELARHGVMPLGSAVWTGAGRLPQRGLIHVAGIDLLWRGSRRSVRDSTTNALAVAAEHGVRSLAFPLIGSGSGSLAPDVARRTMLEVMAASDFDGELRLVLFPRRG